MERDEKEQKLWREPTVATGEQTRSFQRQQRTGPKLPCERAPRARMTDANTATSFLTCCFVDLNRRRVPRAKDGRVEETREEKTHENRRGRQKKEGRGRLATFWSELINMKIKATHVGSPFPFSFLSLCNAFMQVVQWHGNSGTSECVIYTRGSSGNPCFRQAPQQSLDPRCRLRWSHAVCGRSLFRPTTRRTSFAPSSTAPGFRPPIRR